jgi:hypothetical protein
MPAGEVDEPTTTAVTIEDGMSVTDEQWESWKMGRQGR